MKTFTAQYPFLRQALIVSITLGIAACASPKRPSEQVARVKAAAEKEAYQDVKTAYDISIWPKRELSPPRDAEIESKVAGLLAKMSIEEKVGQIIQPEIKSIDVSDIKQYHLGSVLNGGGTTPGNSKYATVEDWANLAEEFYQASMDESDGKVGIPILWGSDAVHGNNNVFGATLFPHNIGLGAANDIELMSRIGSATAKEMAITGLDWTFGPTVAVVRDDRWGRTYESYSERPEIVGRYAKAMVAAIQGAMGGDREAGTVIATAKHFLGDGGTTNGIDRGDTKVSEQELMQIHGSGYIAALDANVLTTMASFNSWNGMKLHGHKYLLTDVLKERMGFDGFVVGDWNGHGQIPGCTVDHCPQAINAGLDMFMVPQDWKALFKNTVADVESGAISMERLNDAVSRVLRVKFHAGLFAAGPIKSRPLVNDKSHLGSSEHRAIAREAVRKSLVLLKNNDNILPIKPNANVLVVGSAADNIGQQSGGWTISWQGTGNTNEDFPGATSIFAGIEQWVNASGGSAVLSPKGEWTERSFPQGAKPEVAIAVIGEEPYAEWHGDIVNIEYQYASKTDLAMLKKLREQGIPVVTVFISGRPLWVNKELNASNAFVAAWLPGSEGAGVADVLFSNIDGSLRHDFSGRLSFSWPARPSQLILNQPLDKTAEQRYDPLFAYGYGLNYRDKGMVSDALSESSVRSSKDILGEQWLFVSRANSPWEFNLVSGGDQPIVVNGNTASAGQGDNLQLTSVDKVSQEDARRLIWSGTEPAAFYLASEVEQNLNDYLAANASLSFQIKPHDISESALELQLICSDDCSKSVDLSKSLNTGQAWTDVSVPLSCLLKPSSSLARVLSVFHLSSSGTADVSVANIKLVPSTEQQPESVCDF